MRGSSMVSVWVLLFVFDSRCHGNFALMWVKHSQHTSNFGDAKVAPAIQSIIINHKLPTFCDSDKQMFMHATR